MPESARDFQRLRANGKVMSWALLVASLLGRQEAGQDAAKCRPRVFARRLGRAIQSGRGTVLAAGRLAAVLTPSAAG